MATDIDSGVEPDAPAPEGDATTTPPASGDQPKPEDKTKQPDPKDAQSEHGKARDARKAKEEERAKNQWQVIEQEKAKLRAEREQLAREREEATNAKAPPKPVHDEHGKTAEDYDKVAKEFRDEGRDDLARASEARAAKLREKQTEAPRTPPTSTAPDKEQLAKDIEEEAAALIAEDASLADEKNPVVVASLAFFRHPELGRFFHTKGGLRASIVAAKLQLAADAKVSGLEKELAASKAEVARLTKATSIPGGPGGQPRSGGAKGIAEMSFAEQEAELARMAAESMQR
jgi:hypothetical protein